MKDKSFSRMGASEDDRRRIQLHFQQVFNAAQLLKPRAIGIENYLTFEPNGVRELRAAIEKLFKIAKTTSPTNEELYTIFADRDWFRAFVEQLQAVALCLQTQQEGVGLGPAAKTIAVFGMAMTVGFVLSIPVFVFQPWQLKKRFCGKNSASKQEVGAALEGFIHGLAEQMAEKVPQKTLKEHAWDGSGHAVLAAETLVELGAAFGGGQPA